jgi:HK97 family phage prohead protease
MTMRGSTLLAGRERRTVAADATIEERGDGDEQELRFTGHAAVFNERTWIGPKRWGFWEEIDPGFFRNVLDDEAAFLVNHDPNQLLARNGKTMTLTVDKKGLVPDATWDPEDPDARMWAGRVRRGDINKMSFAFTVAEEKWAEDAEGEEIRTLLTAERLYDVALVTYPAYDGTDGTMRDQAAEVVLRHRGYDPRTEEAPQTRAEPGELAVMRHRLLAARHRLPLTHN